MLPRRGGPSSQRPHGPNDDGPRYPGTCRDRDAPSGLTARTPSIRLRAAPLEEVEFIDGVYGPQRQRPGEAIGDFVLLRGDGVFAYQLAVVVDDAAMGITEVVRGHDLLGSTPRQLLLYRALGLPPPRFAHVPLVVGSDGARLAKRHGAVSLAELRASGLRPSQLVSWLAASLGLGREGNLDLTPRDLVEDFHWDRLSREPATWAPAP